jgi:peptidoglycan L-alanyl-D-glutamate endopeptidase CwlK
MNEVVKHFDCTIIEGHRNEQKQNEAFASGHSKLKWPNGNHNSMPSKAVDVIPFPIDWNDRERMTLFAGFVMGIAQGMGIDIRWGGDWNENTQVKDNKFDDLVHFEVK